MHREKCSITLERVQVNASDQSIKIYTYHKTLMIGALDFTSARVYSWCVSLGNP